MPKGLTTHISLPEDSDFVVLKLRAEGFEVDILMPIDEAKDLASSILLVATSRDTEPK